MLGMHKVLRSIPSASVKRGKKKKEKMYRTDSYELRKGPFPGHVTRCTAATLDFEHVLQGGKVAGTAYQTKQILSSFSSMALSSGDYTWLP